MSCTKDIQATNFEKSYKKVLKQMKKLSYDDQTRMIRLLVAYFNYDERLKRRELRLEREFRRI